MTTLQALLLGTLQGLTEFLPISSSGHLVIAEHLLELRLPVADLQSFDIILHAGTLLAIVTVYRVMWWDMAVSMLHPTAKNALSRKLLVLLILGTIPAGVVGLLLEDFISAHMRSLTSVGLSLIGTGLLLVLADRIGKTSNELHRLSPRGALLIGCMQAIALIPGCSRSGLTISGGRFFGLRATQAIDFAFLLAVPAIAGASLITLLRILQDSTVLPSLTMTSVGFVSSFLTSIVAILFLRYLVSRVQLGWFAIYLIPAGCFLLFS